MYLCMIFIGFHLQDHPFGAGVGKITMRLILEAETSTLDLEKNRLSHFQQISNTTGLMSSAKAIILGYKIGLMLVILLCMYQQYLVSQATNEFLWLHSSGQVTRKFCKCWYVHILIILCNYLYNSFLVGRPKLHSVIVGNIGMKLQWDAIQNWLKMKLFMMYSAIPQMVKWHSKYQRKEQYSVFRYFQFCP